ncbi:SusC/RagA family TonB-linked outer membrane protein [Segatella bryantii]|uniref:SusC/RagA family TonB-linked outer membrane protein n=1 Tax=Segatella bryantii TaxID=77095 RepID=UPI00241FFB47|nr:TonB-dependent receptor [Segatella bryantii]
MSGNLNYVRIALVSSMLTVAGNVCAQTVKGNVKDNTGEPIIGATVIEDGASGNGAVTDIDGNFTINLKGKSNKVKISYVGMKTKTINVAGKSNIDVKLEDDAQNLNDVVVIGYGTVRKKDLTGSVSSISADDIAGVPVSNVGEAMTGKLAGVNITTTEGSPDADVKIRVRGGGSLSQDNSPLYIVDGFPVSSISDIAPSEIESIDVLKDASSTAIYGARGANGVVIITTKSGKEGKVQVNFNASLGFKKLTKELKVMDPYNYALYQYEMDATEYGNYQDMDIWKSVKGTNYQDEIFGRTGVQRQYNTNISGGSKDLKYNIGFAHNDEDAIMKGSGYSKNNVNAKINSNLNKWLSLDFNARLQYTKIDGLSGGADTNESNAANSVVANTLRWRPIEPLSASNDDENSSTSTQRSPIQRIDATYKQKTRFRQNYNAGLNWKPWKNWTFRSELGYSWSYDKTDNVWASDAVTNSKYGNNGLPQLRYERDDTKTFRNANTVTYDNKKLFGGRDHINVLLGQEWSIEKETERYNTSVAFPASFSIEDVLANPGFGTALSNEGTIAADNNMASFFGRVNYTLAEKYLATFTLRADGSSKFGDGHQWGVFPSLALAWRMSDEEWLKNVKWLSNLKARLSFGTAGNNRIPSGLLTTTYSVAEASSKHAAFDETAATQLERKTYLYNPELKWETTITRNFGIDYGFWKGRINGTLDFYWNTTKDLLMKVEIPSSTGYSYQYQNFGKTENIGVELALNAALVQKKKFNLDATFNISYNKNKIKELNTQNPWQSSNFAGSTFTPYNDFRVEEGGSLGEVWGYENNGFYTVYDSELNPNGELVLNGTSWVLRDGIKDNSYSLTGGQLYPGGIKFTVDENGDPIKKKLGNTVPKVTGGFGLNGNWGNFDFNLYFNYSLGNKVVNGTKLANSFFSNTSKNYNLIADFNLENRYSWIDPETGDNLVKSLSADFIAAHGGAEAIMRRLCEINAGANIWNPVAVTKSPITSYAVEDASFLRLNTVTVGYTLPKTWLKNIFINNVRVYFSAYNVFCITGYDGYDPEVDTSSKKNPMTPGIDYAAYPKSRTFVGGINVTF